LLLFFGNMSFLLLIFSAERKGKPKVILPTGRQACRDHDTQKNRLFGAWFLVFGKGQMKFGALEKNKGPGRWPVVFYLQRGALRKTEVNTKPPIFIGFLVGITGILAISPLEIFSELFGIGQIIWF